MSNLLKENKLTLSKFKTLSRKYNIELSINNNILKLIKSEQDTRMWYYGSIWTFALIIPYNFLTKT